MENKIMESNKTESNKTENKIEITLNEYNELLMIKGKYEELKYRYEELERNFNSYKLNDRELNDKKLNDRKLNDRECKCNKNIKDIINDIQIS